MKIWALAANTFRGFLRDKVIIVFLILFGCVVLLMISPLLAVRAFRGANVEAQTMMFSLVAGMIGFVSGCGSLLAAWVGADSVASEMKSGTILAVMARPVERWHFLLGKYCGVMLLMAAYTALTIGLTYLLLWLGGMHVAGAQWEMAVYPLVRYAIYAAIAMLLVTFMHPVIAWAITVILAVLAMMVAPNVTAWKEWIRKPLYIILPSTGLLSESRFLALTQSSLKPMSWLAHLTALSYGLDYAFVCLLLAMWSFHYRSLRRD